MGLVLLLAYIALNLLSPGELFTSIAPYRPLMVLALVSLPPAILARLQTPEIGKLRTQFVLVILFFGYASSSWFPHGWFGGNLITFLEMAPNVMVYFLGIVFLRGTLHLRLLRATLVMVALYVMAAAFAQLPYARASGDSTPYVLMIEGVLVRIRGLGVLHDPNVFGQYLLIILPMLFVGKRPTGLGLGYVVALPLAALLIVGVYFTGSRGTEMGLAVLLGLYLTLRYKKAGAAFSVFVGSILLVAINFTQRRTITMSSGMDRLAIWSDGMQYFKSSPLWGIGAGGFTGRNSMTAHNSYLLCAAELGILGFFLWMSIVVVTMIQLARVPKVVGPSNPDLARWAMALRLSLGVYLFTGFFLSRAYDLPLFLLLGMSGAIITAAGGDDAIPLHGTMWPAWSFGLCVSTLVLIYAVLRLRMV